MPFALGQRSLSFVSHVDPRLLEVAKLAISLSTQDFGFDEEQSRTLAQEEQLVREGKSHTLHSHHIIGVNGPLGAPGCLAVEPGCSGAVDAVPWNGKIYVWEWPRIWPIAAAFQTASRQLGIPVTWGGCWDRLLEELAPGPTGVMAGSADYVARRRGAGLSAFVDGPHFELGRN